MAEGGDFVSLIRRQEIQTETGAEGETNRYYTPSETPETPSLGSQHRLICPLCLSDVKRPKQLSECFHIFCASCLEKYINATAINNQPSSDSLSDITPLTIVCPTCEKRFVCPEDVIAWLQSETYLHTFQGQVSIYSESGNVLCSSSHHDQYVVATKFCLECSKNFCGDCDYNHSGNDDHRSHHTLHLYQAQAEMTVDMGRQEMLQDPRDNGSAIQCPICRNTAVCEHLQTIRHLNELLQTSNGANNDICPLHPNVPLDKKLLIGFCKDCETPICEKCKTMQHDNHKTELIENAQQDKLLYIKEIKNRMKTRMDMFKDAAVSAQGAAEEFTRHIQKVQQKMLARKGSIQTMIETAFNSALGVIGTTGRKQAELNRQIQEMQEEENFLQAVITLADSALKPGTPLEVIQIWKGLSHIQESMGGESEKKSAKVVDAILPQQIIEKRLVLPAPNCMTPDISILGKIGVENSRLQPPTSIINVKDNLLLFYSILPLTQTEVLVSCLIEAYKNAVIQYSCWAAEPITLDLAMDGEYCLVQVPGNGIVTTFYHRGGGGKNDSEKKQIMFWDAEVGSTVKEMERKGAGNKLKELTKTKLPPRGIAVTCENHLVVVCTEEDTSEQKTEIVLMTLKGDVLEVYRPKLPSSKPRYVTVNINGDVCVTDARNQMVMVLSSELKEKLIIRNPYKGYGSEEKNKKFCPMGICHDSFGRLIVADSDNNTVLRIEIANNYDFTSTPILQQGDFNAEDLFFPELVALGPGSKLWVVCRSKIMAYYYMDTE